MKCIVCPKQRAQSLSSIVGLRPAFLGELNAVVRDGLVDVAVL